MTIFRIIPFSLVTLFTLVNCRAKIKVKEENKIFHAGPAQSGTGVKFFGLYKDNKYQFCDGDFLDAGCYTGLYALSGDTLILHDLKEHEGIPTNKFIIRRYKDMDSSYWIWKYPEQKIDWKIMQHNDLSNSATGDVFPLDEKNNILSDKNNSFLIRFDSLQNNSK